MIASHNISRLVVGLVLALSYFLMPKYGFTGTLSSGDLYTHLLYPLSHANVWHLAVNVVCLLMVRCRLHLALSYMCAIICSFLPCFVSEPTMGFSGVLFASVAISWGRITAFRRMIWTNKWVLLVPPFLPHVNFMIHLYCMLAGYAVGYLLHRYCNKASHSV